MLTAAIRDLHHSYPDKFLTDIRTRAPEIWENNFYISEISEDDNEARVIDCQYPLIDQSNSAPFHLIHGFIQHLNQELQLNISPTAFKGDIHISEKEKFWPSQVEEVVGIDLPFWIIVSGGKRDYTIKWWDVMRYQKVVDYFQGKICFVQVGRGH